MLLRHWLGGIRLYIPVAGALVAAEVWWWARAVYGDAAQAVIRMQSIYAWTALGLVFAALVIGPLLKIFPRLPGKGLLRDARRMLGIVAAGFATLHVGINYIGLFGLPNPLQLADSYQRAFLLGVSALVILLLLAFTSFDAVFRAMGVWWFRLHRLIYIAVLLIVMHAFMIGSRSTSVLALSILAAGAVLLLGLHSFLVVRQERPPHLQVIFVTLSVVFAAAVLNYGLTQHLGHNILLHSEDPDGHGHQ